MADILIYGMKMPESEPLRLVLNPNGQLFIDHGVTFTEYEAVELPEHGELIDREWLKEMAYSKVEDFGGAFLDTIDIAIAPVVIPSNKEETE